jgi:Co/Zn/Cd efflux system component
LVALAANVAVLLATLAGGLISGSAAMLAEAAQSLADATNQGLLLVSVALAVLEPTPEQPFGYGRTRFLWTFMAAAAMFLAGAMFAVGYGVYQLTSGPESGGRSAVGEIHSGCDKQVITAGGDHAGPAPRGGASARSSFAACTLA